MRCARQRAGWRRPACAVPFRLSRRAEQDLVAIYLFGYEKFGVAQAERYQEGLFEAIRFVAANPLVMRERCEFRRPIRLFPYSSHIIAYAIVGGDVLIVRVLHGHQDTSGLF